MLAGFLRKTREIVLIPEVVDDIPGLHTPATVLLTIDQIVTTLEKSKVVCVRKVKRGYIGYRDALAKLSSDTAAVNNLSFKPALGECKLV